ncbi:MAG: hypothetical protein Ct9H90mP5_08630 [Acidimicrobiaceae bacterium]|nr:MAG: hypothetical protein Ct9H90mP5_08630 [Acidimicrobiaceae bacterium]
MQSKSQLKLGAPFANGTSLCRAAYAYIWLGEIFGSLFFNPSSNAATEAWTSLGS